MFNQSKYIIIQNGLLFLTILIESRSGKTNVFLNLIKYQRLDIDKIYIYVKDSFESKYQLLINGRGIENLKNPKVWIDHSQTIDDVYEVLEDYNTTKKRKMLIVFDDVASEWKLIKH